jgi:hypothetical protein
MDTAIYRHTHQYSDEDASAKDGLTLVAEVPSVVAVLVTEPVVGTAVAEIAKGVRGTEAPTVYLQIHS